MTTDRNQEVTPDDELLPDVDIALMPELSVAEHLVAQALDEDWRPPQQWEMWRLEFDGTTSIVAVLHADDDRLRVAPVGEDPHLADAATVIVTDEDSPLGFSFGVWVGLATTVPTFTADVLLGDVKPFAVEIEQVERWLASSDEADLPAGRVGAPMFSDTDVRIDYRHALQSDLMRLAAAPQMLNAAATEPVRNAGEVLRGADVTPGRLRDELGWDADRARQAFRGRLVAAEDEATHIASVLGLNEHVLREAIEPINPRLLVELHRPHRRRALRARAANEGLPPVEMRRTAARRVQAGVRRQVGVGEPDWAQLVDDYLRDETH